MDSQGDETTQSLITVAAKHGHRITPVMLKKWRGLGLLPRPLQRSLGRGQGTETIYPVGSTAQIIRLLEIRAEGGRFDPERAAWLLWWEAWTIDPDRMRELLEKRLVSWEHGDAAFADDEGDLLDRFERDRLPQTLAKARKRAGTKAMPTVATLILNAFGGRAQEQWQDADDAPTLLRALGLESIVRSLGPDEADFKAWVARLLRNFGDAVAPRRMREALETTGETELTVARDDLRNIVAFARGIYRVESGSLPHSNAGSDVLSMSPDDAIEELPSAVLCIRALRCDSNWQNLLNWFRFTDLVVTELTEAIAKESQSDKKPPRRRQLSGGTAQGERTSKCTTSLAPPSPRPDRDTVSSF